MAISFLLVDDSAMFRAVTHRVILDAMGDRPVEITEAEDGEQAVAAITKAKFDFILLDLTMPKMDGYAFLEHVRKVAYPAKVIVMSADTQAGAFQRVRELGGFAFLPKPLVKAALIKTLMKASVL